MDTLLSKVIVEIINPIIYLLTAVAFLIFVWGIYEFVKNAADATKRAEGREAILWGIVGLLVIFGAYEIINIALTTAGVPRISVPR